MREYDVKLAKTQCIIEESELYKVVENVLGDKSSDAQNLFLCSFLGVTTPIALADKKLYTSEVDFIVSGFPSMIKLENDVKKSLTNIFLGKLALEKNLGTLIPHFVEYLRKKLKPKDLQKVVQILFLLGCADGELVESERKLIHQIAKRMDVPPDIVTKVETLCLEKQNAKVELDQELKLITQVVKFQEDIQIRKFVKTPDSQIEEELWQSLSQLEVTYIIERIFPKCSQKAKLLLMAYTGCIFENFKEPNSILEKEYKFLKSSLNSWFIITEKALDTFIDISIWAKEKGSFTKKTTDSYLKVLNEYLDNNEKEKFVEVLFNLSNSDNESSRKNILNPVHLANLLQIDEKIVKNIQDLTLGIEGSFKVIQSGSSWELK